MTFRSVVGALGAALILLASLSSPAAAQSGLFDDTMFDSDLIKAIRSGDDDALRAAIIAGDNINDRSGTGSPAIVVAAESRNLDAIQMLADAGARIDNENRRTSATALTVAAELGEAPIVRELLTRGANPDKTGSGGEPALLKAARNGHAQVVQVLIDGGADLEVTDLSGATAVEIAEQNRHRQVAQILRDAGAY
jgi:ankyrin repeat protein